ncbi:MAG: YhgE/Pip family protein [Coriobacteriales bacterium]|jgi:putative membrane protein
MRSPFTGMRFAMLELENVRASKMIKLALCFIALIPLFYGGLFLLAFLDPYGSLVNVPAAVVNLDEGGKVNGEERNIGQELCDQLVENNEDRQEGQATGYDWKFVDVDSATKGLEDGTYYMELIIPENFTDNIASASNKNPEKAELQVYFNPSTNLIAQTVGSSMVTKIRAELNESIDEEYFKNIFVQISDASDQLQDAVDGADSLQSGIDKLKTGSDSLKDGIQSAESGSEKITKNLETLSDGASELDDGVGTLSSSLKKLKSGIADAQDSSADLATVITGVADALQAYNKTSDTSYLTKAKRLAKKAKSMNSTIGSDLYKYVSNLCSKLSAYQTAATKASTAKKAMNSKKSVMESTASNLEDSASDLQGDLTTLASAATSLNSSITELKSSLSSIQTGVSNGTISPATALSQIVSAIGQLDTSSLTKAITAVVSSSTSGSGPETLINLSKFQSALEEYQDAANDYTTAATSEANAGAKASKAAGTVTGYLKGVSNTSKVASASTKTVSSAVSKLYKAVNGTLKSGTSDLASGASKLASGSNTLTLGLADAESGSKKISKGLSSASDGTAELKDGLSDGQEEMADNAENGNARSKMMSSPVSANGDNQTGESITEVKNYGTGFAPYFIGLGMWVGALMVSFLIRSLNNRILMSGASSIAATLSSYLPMFLVCALQAILLLLFIQFVLGMDIKYPVAFYLFGIVVAGCFAAIIQFFRASLGTVGMVVIVLLLMLQLCTAAGTFPIEAELPFFNWLNPYLPMTYVVQGFRMAMSGLSLSYFYPACAIILLFGVAFFFFTVLVARHKRRVTMMDLYPPLKLAS